MRRLLANRLACWMMAGFLVLATTAISRSAGNDDADRPVRKTAKEEKKRRGLLPPHYKKIVTETQKEKIYAIQAEYGPKIKALEEQLRGLKAEQREKIEAVLTPEQKEKVRRAESEARAARKKEKAGKKENEVVEPEPAIPQSPPSSSSK